MKKPCDTCLNNMYDPFNQRKNCFFRRYYPDTKQWDKIWKGEDDKCLNYKKGEKKMRCFYCKKEMQYLGKSGLTHRYYCATCKNTEHITPTDYHTGSPSWQGEIRQQGNNRI
jgi:hypothetical protein